jgi:hypothetical protein
MKKRDMTHNHVGQEDISTLRLLMPQWQGGGNRPAYHLGAQLLAWLAPASTAAFEEVPIDLRNEGLTIDRASLRGRWCSNRPMPPGASLSGGNLTELWCSAVSKDTSATKWGSPTNC